MSAYYAGPNPPDAAELRVLGALIEKRRTTPDGYPLSVNSLRLACNQATNRDPVVEYDDDVVLDALERLGRRGWTRLASGPGTRARKYRHLFDEALDLADDELSMLAVLMLRGPQTPGELKQRTERLYRFADLAAVEDTLLKLIDRDLVVGLDRQPGQKERRFVQLLDGGDGEEPVAAPVPAATPAHGDPLAGGAASSGAAPVAASAELEERVDSLERQVAELSGELRALRAELGP